MGLMKRFNKKNKTEFKEETRKRELFLKEFDILSKKWGYDLSSEIVFEKGVIMSRPILIKNEDKQINNMVVNGDEGNSVNPKAI